MKKKVEELWERGSGMVMAIFVLFLVTSLGVALLFLSNTEVKLSQADGRGKVAYYHSEAGLEKGRAVVHYANMINLPDIEYFNDELQAAAGGNPGDVIDFNLANLTATFDSDGNLTSLSGFNDDQPALPLTSFGDGMHAAFLTNDPAEGISTTTDNNKKVMITGVGAGPDRSLEIVQAIVERVDLYPMPPATITILGEENCDPDCADFWGGTSIPKRYKGDDTGAHCPGGTPGLWVPVIGVIGDSSVGSVIPGVQKKASYTTDGGNLSGDSTVTDLTDDPTLDPIWTDCNLLRDLAAEIRDAADIIGDSSTPNAALGTVADPKIAFIDDDYVVGPSVNSGGILLVTGMLDFHGQADWQGIVLAIGTGDFLRNGSGNGTISGAIIVADIAGPDRILFTADDCAGQDDILGTADDGIAQSSYQVTGGGVGVTGFCSAYLKRWQAAKPLEIVSFVQR
jgi:hypothetical protein